MAIKPVIHSFSDEDKASLLTASDNYLDDWKEKAVASKIDADTLLSEYHALLKKYDDERKSKGYPWNR